MDEKHLEIKEKKSQELEIPTLENALKHITKNGLLILSGTAVGGIIGFVTRIIVIKHISKSEFGILSLALVLLSLIVWLFALSMVSGLSRLISYYKAQSKLERVETIIRSAIWVSLGVGIGVSILLLCVGNKVFNVFHSTELFPIFCILVSSVPFIIFTALCIQIFLGFGMSQPKIYLDPAGSSLIRLMLILIVIFFGGVFGGFTFISIIWAYLLAFILTGLMALFYAKENLPKFVNLKIVGEIDKEVVTFSLPLLGGTIFSLTLGWADTLFIGYFHNPEKVGMYNVAFTLGNIIPYLFLVNIGYIYLPIATQYFSKNMLSEVKNLCSSFSRWIFIFTIIPTFIFLIFPKQTLTLFFGERYIDASFALTLIAGGFLVQVMFGPIGIMLLASGEIKTILLANIIGIVTNISLNFFLVPVWGIVGAAWACFFSVILISLYYFLSLYYKNKISPFSKGYLKVILISAIALLLVYIPGKYLLSVSNWMLPGVIFVFSLIFCMIIFFTGNITEDDKMLWKAIKRRINL